MPELLQSPVLSDEVVAVSCGAFHSAAVSAVGDLYTFGYGRSGQLGFGDTQSSAVPRLVSALNGMDVCLVACGGDYTVAVTDRFMVMQMDYFAQQAQAQQQQQQQLQQHASVNAAQQQGAEEGIFTRAHEGHAPAHAGLSIHPSASPPPHHSHSQAQAQPKPKRGSIFSSVSPPSAWGPGAAAAASVAASATPSLPSASPPAPTPVPPTPIIFREEPDDGLPGFGAVAEDDDDAAPHQSQAQSQSQSQAHDDDGPRIRMSASTNALGDLVGSAGSITKSSSFNSSGGGGGNKSAGTYDLNGGGGGNGPAGTRSGSATPGGSLALSPSSSLSASSSGTGGATGVAVPSASQKTIFQLVKEVFSFAPLHHPDIRAYIPTATPTGCNDPVDGSAAAALCSPNGAGGGGDGELGLGDYRFLSPSSSSSGGSQQKKSEAEVARQRDEVARMNAAYKVKLRKEAKGKALLREEDEKRRKQEDKASKELAKRNLEREHKMDEAAEIWLKQIVPAWQAGGSGSAGVHKKTRELVAKVGIPPRVRGIVWPLALGNQLMVTQELYEIFGQQAQRARKVRVQELRAINNAQQAQAAAEAQAQAQAASAAAAAAAAAAIPSMSLPTMSSSSLSALTVSPASPRASPTSPRAVGPPPLVPASPSSSSSPRGLASSPSFTLGKESTFSYIDVDLTRTYPSLAFFQEGCPMNDQLRHLLYTYCFPADDHQLLTERGFMFLHEVEAAMAAAAAEPGGAEPPLRFASYSPADGRISYHPAKLIIKPGRRHEFVEFTPKDGQAAWAPGADAYGRSSAAAERSAGASKSAPRTSSRSNRLSLLVTPEHDMYVRTGKRGADGGVAWREEVPYEKRTAAALVEAAKREPGLCLRMMARAPAGVAPAADVQQLSFVAALGLGSEASVDAFLQLYGFWLAEGSLRYSEGGPASGAAAESVRFVPPSGAAGARDGAWVVELLRACGLAERVDFALDGDLQSREWSIDVKCDRWLRFFQSEYAHGYLGGRRDVELFGCPLDVSLAELASEAELSAKANTTSIASADAAAASSNEERADVVAHSAPGSDSEGDAMCCPVLAVSEDAASAKCLMRWVWSLGQRHLRLLLAGLQRAEGDSEAGQHSGVIWTTSVRFRDEMQRVCIHAGYACHFGLALRQGECCSSAAKRSGKGAQLAARARRDLWSLHYTDEADASEPVLRCDEDLRGGVVRDGRAWCITLPASTAGILVARRATTATATTRAGTGTGADGSRSGAVVVHASAPTLVGNCFYRPDVGYVQGMSYLAGNLLLYMAPYEAFVAFAHLLNTPFFHVFLKMESAKMQARYRLFEDLLAETEPELARHFAAENIAAELYFMEWCMTLFAKRLKLDVVGRVWDNYLVNGEAVVYRTAVAILRALKADFIHAPFDQIMKKLNATPLVNDCVAALHHTAPRTFRHHAFV